MRIRIRTKLAAALAVPLIALVAVASQEVSQVSERADEVVQEAELATAAAGPTSVISRLQDERNFALIELLGMVGTLELPVASTEEARANTDAAFTELQEFVEARGGDVEDAFARTIEGIDLFLAAVRGQVDLYEGPQDLSIQTVEFALTIYNAYAAFINTIVTDTSGIALDVADADLRTGVELVSRTTNDLEYSAEINRNIFYQSLTGSPLDDARIIVASHLDDYLTNREKIMERAVGPYEGMPEQWLLSEKDAEQQALYAQFVAEGTADLAVLSEALGSTEVPGMVGLRSDISDALTARADELKSDARAQRDLVAALAVVAVVVALVGTILASRSITRPLRSPHRPGRGHGQRAAARTPCSRSSTRRSARTSRCPTSAQVTVDTAATRSPRSPTPSTRCRRSAARPRRRAGRAPPEHRRLVREPRPAQPEPARPPARPHHRHGASRRPTPTSLERLFRLDHLATRMRRNAESLLLPRRRRRAAPRSGRRPVPVVDVLRGALGEVEDYQRVEIMSLDEALDRRLGRRRPHPPRRRAGRERPHLLARPSRDVEIVGDAAGGDGYYRWRSSTTASA